MENVCIISNNSLSLEKYHACAISIKGDVATVFAAARNMIHAGAKLIAHPLSGSIKPNQSPYKSLVLSNGKQESNIVDFDSLKYIENAIAVLAKLPVISHDYSEAVLEDFKVIDLDLLDNAMKRLGIRGV